MKSNNKGLLASLLIITALSGCKKELDPTSEECKCKDGSYFPEENGKCEVRMFLTDQCVWQPESPVCGCNKTNYVNRCYAHMAGVKVYSEGWCK